MKKETKTKGHQVFNVPNTDEGKEFIKMISKYLNRSRFTSIKSRGRGTRKEGKKFHRAHRPHFNPYSSSLPITKAKWIAVYLNQKNFQHKFVGQHSSSIIIKLEFDKMIANNKIKELEAEIEKMALKSHLREQEVIVLCSNCHNEKQNKAVETCKNCEYRKNEDKYEITKQELANLKLQFDKLHTSGIVSLKQDFDALRFVNDSLREENQELRERMRKNEEVIRSLNAIKKFFNGKES